MEDTLREENVIESLIKAGVLILVLMEDTLRVHKPTHHNR